MLIGKRRRHRDKVRVTVKIRSSGRDQVKPGLMKDRVPIKTRFNWRAERGVLIGGINQIDPDRIDRQGIVQKPGRGFFRAIGNDDIDFESSSLSLRNLIVEGGPVIDTRSGIYYAPILTYAYPDNAQVANQRRGNGSLSSICGPNPLGIRRGDWRWCCSRCRCRGRCWRCGRSGCGSSGRCWRRSWSWRRTSRRHGVRYLVRWRALQVAGVVRRYDKKVFAPFIQSRNRRRRLIRNVKFLGINAACRPVRQSIAGNVSLRILVPSQRDRLGSMDCTRKQP